MAVQPADVLGSDATTEPAITRPVAEPWLARPFVVRGMVHGAERGLRVSGPEQAVDTIVGWLQRDEDTCAIWYLHEAYRGEITLVGRPAAGTVGERQRAAHLFTLLPGVPQYGSLTARCGTELDLPTIEWLTAARGMPCERCLLSAAAQHELGGPAGG